MEPIITFLLLFIQVHSGSQEHSHREECVLLMVITINTVTEVRLLVLDKMEKTHFLLHLLLSTIIKSLDIIQLTNTRRLWKVEWRWYTDRGGAWGINNRGDFPTLSFCLPCILGLVLDSGEALNLEVPEDTDKTKIPHNQLPLDKTRNWVIQQDGKIVDNVHLTPAKHHEETMPSPLTPLWCWQRWSGSLDFPFYLEVAHAWQGSRQLSDAPAARVVSAKTLGETWTPWLPPAAVLLSLSVRERAGFWRRRSWRKDFFKPLCGQIPHNSHVKLVRI